MIDGTIGLDAVVAGVSCTGKRSNNEDAFLVMQVEDGYLVAIADGIGGHRAGEVASAIAVSTLSRGFPARYHEGMSPGEVGVLLSDLFKSAHDSIEAGSHQDREGMGTTMVASFIRNNQAVIANTGDSRVYHIRDKVLFRTRDHSVVQSLIDSHQISETDARRHPLRAMITNSLGSAFLVDIYYRSLKPGDLLLLSSDGFHDYVDEEVIMGADKTRPVTEIVQDYVKEALVSSRDNVTVIVYRTP